MTVVACNATGFDLLPACSARDNFPEMNHWVVGEPLPARTTPEPLGALPAWGDSLRQGGRRSESLRLASMMAGFCILETRMDGECGIHCMNIFQAGRVERSFPESRHRKTIVSQHERFSTPAVLRSRAWEGASSPVAAPGIAGHRRPRPQRTRGARIRRCPNSALPRGGERRRSPGPWPRFWRFRARPRAPGIQYHNWRRHGVASPSG